MVRRIIKFPAPSLRVLCREVSFPLTEELQQHIRDLKDTLAATPNGVALASNQVAAEGHRVFIVKPGLSLPEVVINPTWRGVDALGEGLCRVKYLDEGCLSIPEHQTKIHRNSLILAEFQDETGVKHVQEVLGLASQIVQHECEHLDGKLLLDHADRKTQVRVRAEAIRNRKRGK